LIDGVYIGLGEVHSVAVDWVGENIYIADVVLQSIFACSLRGHHCSAVSDAISLLGPIAIDSNNGYVHHTTDANSYRCSELNEFHS